MRPEKKHPGAVADRNLQRWGFVVGKPGLGINPGGRLGSHRWEKKKRNTADQIVGRAPSKSGIRRHSIDRRILYLNGKIKEKGDAPAPSTSVAGNSLRGEKGSVGNNSGEAKRERKLVVRPRRGD